MLQTQSVNPELLELLNKIMQDSAFNKFLLVGGTSLALQIGHRISVDIDLFGEQELNEPELSSIINKFGKSTLLNSSPNVLVYEINGIKLDIVNYPYPWLELPLIEGNLRLAQFSDIGAMKLNAIAGRGSKKDFIDLFFLLKIFTLSELMKAYLKKYSNGSEFLVLKSLSYFDDADQEPSPKMIVPITWKEIKSKLINEIKKYQ